MIPGVFRIWIVIAVVHMLPPDLLPDSRRLIIEIGDSLVQLRDGPLLSPNRAHDREPSLHLILRTSQVHPPLLLQCNLQRSPTRARYKGRAAAGAIKRKIGHRTCTHRRCHRFLGKCVFFLSCYSFAGRRRSSLPSSLLRQQWYKLSWQSAGGRFEWARDLGALKDLQVPCQYFKDRQS